MRKTKISWTDDTWNPVSGCAHGCEYCYARKIAERFKDKGQTVLGDALLINENNGVCCYEFPENPHAAYPVGFAPTLFCHRLGEYKNAKSSNIFVCSTGDLFGKWVPDRWLDMVFDACEAASQHNYMFLTKNPKRYTEYHVPLRDNYWYGTTVTCSNDTWHADYLPAFANLFLSIEPLQEDFAPKSGVIFKPNYTQWVIIGAETGNRKGKIVPEREWVEHIVEACRKYNTPVFMKESLMAIWGESLIQEFPESLIHKDRKEKNA